MKSKNSIEDRFLFKRKEDIVAGRKVREEMKQLESIKTKLQGEIEGLKTQKSNISKEISLKQAHIQKITEKIKTLSQGAGNEIIISEHAILRYIERVLQIPLEEIEQKIVSSTLKEQIKMLGDGSYPLENGKYRIVVKDNIVVTILGDDMVEL